MALCDGLAAYRGDDKLVEFFYPTQVGVRPVGLGSRYIRADAHSHASASTWLVYRA